MAKALKLEGVLAGPSAEQMHPIIYIWLHMRPSPVRSTLLEGRKKNA
jgi:hypothetical protein